MSIRCVCPNGHVLKAKDSLAGAIAACPACKCPVTVPPAKSATVSEDAIMEMLGGPKPAAKAAQQGGEDFGMAEESARDALSSNAHGRTSGNKRCDRCHREVASGVHICPHCHAYIANLGDF